MKPNLITVFASLQVRRESSNMEDCSTGAQLQNPRLKRVSANDFFFLIIVMVCVYVYDIFINVWNLFEGGS